MIFHIDHLDSTIEIGDEMGISISVLDWVHMFQMAQKHICTIAQIHGAEMRKPSTKVL